MSRQRSKLECSHLLAPSPLWSLSKKLCQQKIFGQAYLYSTIMKILPQDKTIRGCQGNFRGGYLSSMGVLIIAKSELATCPCPCPSLHHWWPVLFASEWKVNKTVWNQKTTQLHTKSFFGLFSIRDLSWRSIPLVPTSSANRISFAVNLIYPRWAKKCPLHNFTVSSLI